LGRQTDEAELAAMLEVFFPYYLDHIADSSRPFPGVEAVVGTFQNAGIRLGVCTNKLEENARKLLSELNLMPLFGAIAGGNTFAVRKPHPAHVLGTVDLLHGDTSRTILVGDSTADAEAAKAAKVPFVAVSYGYAGCPTSDLGADIVIDTFDELPTAVEQFFQ
jgi:phosphoglycolate phosphatase